MHLLKKVEVRDSIAFEYKQNTTMTPVKNSIKVKKTNITRNKGSRIDTIDSENTADFKKWEIVNKSNVEELRSVLKREKVFDLKYEKEGGLINESEYLNPTDFEHLKEIENQIMVWQPKKDEPEELEYVPIENPVQKMYNRVKDGEAVVKIQSE